MTQILPEKVLKEFKEIDRKKIRQGLAQEFENFPFKIIVLDDDPTGVQTVHDVSVYTDWDEASIRAGFEEQNKMFFILTNSRSFPAEKTKAVHQEIAGRIAKIAQEKNKKFIIISRGDSKRKFLSRLLKIKPEKKLILR